jgi:hypothetical protein
MPRQRIGVEPMSPAERQARHRAKLRRPTGPAFGRPEDRLRHALATSPTPARRGERVPERSRAPALPRPIRWAAAVTALVALQEEYRAWLDNLPTNLDGSPLADKLRAIAELDLEELQAIDPPRGYGRD